MTALTTQQTEASVLSDFFDHTEQLQQLVNEARAKYCAALTALHADSSDEARLLTLVIINSGGVFLEAMEEAYDAGRRLGTLWDEAVECRTLSDVELADDLMSCVESNEGYCSYDETDSLD